MKLVNLKYQAICLDTNIFERYKYKFEKSLLGKLKNFKESGIYVIVPSIIYKEVVRHFELECEKRLRSFEDACADLVGFFNVNEDVVSNLKNEFGIVSCQSMFNKYCKDCGIVIVSADSVNSESLVSLYDKQDPPFGGNGKGGDKKKNEFPDAIALLSLEGWAECHGGKVLAVSQDKGWQRYAEGSYFLDVVDDLPSGLNRFYAENVMPEVFEYFKGSALVDYKLDDDIFELASAMYDGAEFDVTGSSTFVYEVISSVGNVLDSNIFIGNNGDAECDIVDVYANRIDVVYRVRIDFEVHIKYSLKFIDVGGGGTIDLGCFSTKRRVSREASALMYFSGDFSGDLSLLDYELAIDGLDVDTSEMFVGEFDPSPHVVEKRMRSVQCSLL